MATSNLGNLFAADIPVRACCRKCGQFKDVKVVALAAAVGADLGLWNRHASCRITEGCDDRVTFTFMAGGVRKYAGLRARHCRRPPLVRPNLEGVTGGRRQHYQYALR